MPLKARTAVSAKPLWKMPVIRLLMCALLVAGATACSDKKKNAEVSLKLDPQKAGWFKDAKFGMFIHWGLYSILEGTYDGHFRNPSRD